MEDWVGAENVSGETAVGEAMRRVDRLILCSSSRRNQYNDFKRAPDVI